MNSIHSVQNLLICIVYNPDHFDALSSQENSIIMFSFKAVTFFIIIAASYEL